MNKRNVNIDLLRIVSMLMIVVLHVLLQGGLLSSQNKINFYSTWLIEIICFISVNCYALITGYLMIDTNKWKIERLLQLWVQVFFYSILLLALGLLFFSERLPTSMIISSIFPLFRRQYWYFSAYAGLFLLVPFLNIMINNLDKNTMKRGLIIIFIVFSCLSSLFKSPAFNTADGYSMLWLIFVYFIGAYIKRHLNLENFSIKKVKKYYILNLGITFLLFILLSLVSNKLFGKLIGASWLINYTSPFIVISSILFFMLILKTTINNERIIKVITWTAPYSFAVYLIHTHPVSFLLLKNLFLKYTNVNILIVVSIIFSATLLIYILCTGIDYLRLKLFTFIKIDTIIGKIASLIETKVLSLSEKIK